MQLTTLLTHCASQFASDLHLSPGEPPIMRLYGQLHRLPGSALETENLCKALQALMPSKLHHRLATENACDFRLSLEETQARIHLYWQHNGLAAAIRLLPSEPPEITSLGLPAAITDWVHISHGLILICGATGSGKSTTLAALIHQINKHRACHIVTLEDPIEFQHHGLNALITQREVSTHQGGFAHALKTALREDPDIIMVGEMRDRETISLVLEAAETGHLVLSTLHTRSTANAIARICSTFSFDTQQAIRLQLSQSLYAIMAQTLLPSINTKQRVLAHEVLYATCAVQHVIRENKLEQIETLLQTGRQHGMYTLRQCIDQLVAHKHIKEDSLPFDVKAQH